MADYLGRARPGRGAGSRPGGKIEACGAAARWPITVGMVTPKCERCKRVIPGEDVHVANDIAYCRACNLAYSLAELTRGAALAQYDLSRPPAGAWVRRDGHWRTIGATHRSWGGALGLLFASVFWNGIVSVFVFLALASTLKHLDIPLPEWFPAPKMKGGEMPVGMTIFLWLFLTPFMVIGLGLVLGFFSSLAGRTEIRLRGSEGELFTGVGPVGRRRRFATAAVKRVRVEEETWRDSKGRQQAGSNIVLELADGKVLKCGSMLTAERRAFLAAALRGELGNRA